jgi:uncharacterized protein (TIGR02391 family)
MTKWKRLNNALVNRYNETKQGNHILAFISKALEPSRFLGKKEKFNYLTNRINGILLFHGLEFRDDGNFYSVKKVNSLSEAEMRTSLLKSGINERKLHPLLLNYCRDELLKESYFHAIFESTKGIADIIRTKINSNLDGAKLVDFALSGDNPKIKINSHFTESEKSEQKGFTHIVKGLFGTYRNPIAHEVKEKWNIPFEDTLDFFTIASYIIRRIERIQDDFD